jgi:octopine/nopaline transport system substrate-binding protein
MISTSGRIETAFSDASALEDFLVKPDGKDFQMVDVKIASSSDPTLGEGVGVGIAQENTELKAKIDKALCELVNDGSIGKASETWFKTDISRPCK